MIILQKQPKTRSDLVKVYILHGWTYSLEKWDPFIKILEKNKLNPILLKIPGLTQKIEKPWTIEDYTNWLTKEIGNEEKINIIGHSNGGRIAINFAIKNPNKIRRLILIDSAGVYHNDLVITLKRTVFKIISKAGRRIINIPSAKKLLYKAVGEEDYEKADKTMKRTMINLIESDKNLAPECITNKTLIVWGEKDKITPISDGEVLEKLIVNSKLSTVGNARHSPQFTHPRETAKIILKEL